MNKLYIELDVPWCTDNNTLNTFFYIQIYFDSQKKNEKEHLHLNSAYKMTFPFMNEIKVDTNTYTYTRLRTDPCGLST